MPDPFALLGASDRLSLNLSQMCELEANINDYD
jgi:hypothetical protein